MDPESRQDFPQEGPKPKKQKLIGVKWKNHTAPASTDRNKSDEFHRGYRDRTPPKHSKDRERSPGPDETFRRRERTPPREQRWRDEDRRRDDQYRDRDSYRPRDRDYDRYDSRRDERRYDRRREQDRPYERQARQDLPEQRQPEQGDDLEQTPAAKPVDSELSQSVADKFGLPSNRTSKKDKPNKTPRITAPSEPMIIVNINDRLGTKASIPCLASDSVKAFKAIVAAHIGRQPHEIMLKRQGERPFKDQLTLEDYGVSSGVQLDLEIDTGS